MWLLEHDGAFRHGEAPAGHQIEGGAPIDAAPDAALVTVRFGGPADGRGFSTARRLRARGFTGRLVATGPLLPDQAREAFQCGFDAIALGDDLVARHGVAAWRDALTHSVGALYADAPTARGARPIWHARHS